MSGVVDTQSEFNQIATDSTAAFSLTTQTWTEVAASVSNLNLNAFNIMQPCEVELFWSASVSTLDLEQGVAGSLTGPYCYDVLICVFNAITYSALNLPPDFTFTSSNRKLAYGGSYVSGVTDLKFACEAVSVGSSSESEVLTVTVQNSDPYFDYIEADQSVTVYDSLTYSYSTFGDPDPSDTLTITASLEDDSVLPSWITLDTGANLFVFEPTHNS